MNQPSKLSQEKARLARLQARKISLHVKAMEGELVPVSDVKAALSRMFSEFRQRTLALPSRLASQLAHLDDPKDIHELISLELHTLLKELAAYDPGSMSLPSE